MSPVPTASRPKCNVFFSWQSDVEQSATTTLIRSALKTAKPLIDAELNCECVIDEATRNVSGSPNIPQTILNKIRRADVFMADITTICVDPATSKSLPNPNVNFELGFALAHLGWSRIILIYNEAVSPFQNLPFDFNQNRITKFRTSLPTPKVKEEAKIDELIRFIVEAVIVADPKRPRELEGKSVEDLQREKDIVILNGFLSRVSTTLIEDHVDALPEHIYMSAAITSDMMQSALSKTGFKFYDTRLREIIEKMSDYMHRTLAFDEYYGSVNEQIGVQGLQHRHDPAFDTRRTKDLRSQDRSKRKLAKWLASFTSHIRDNYVDIDVISLDLLARQALRRSTGYPR